MDGRNRVNLGSCDHYAFEIRRLGRVQNPDYRAEPILVFSLWFHVVMSGPWLRRGRHILLSPGAPSRLS